MAFRAGDAALSGYARAQNMLIPRTFDKSDRASEALDVLEELIDQLGPVVDAYPTWHPLVTNHSDRQPETYPSERCGYRGLDHTVLFLHGFVTCPYGDGEAVIESAEKQPYRDYAEITATRLNTEFYNSGTTAILVRCNWSRPLGVDKMVPKNLAVPLMLEKELPCWRWAERAEPWETMRPYLLGSPHGGRSSLFVNQETALAMKNVYMAMINSGMFGPLKMG